jgi:predicted lipoprotein with Yx(FWY)xxD motif
VNRSALVPVSSVEGAGSIRPPADEGGPAVTRSGIRAALLTLGLLALAACGSSSGGTGSAASGGSSSASAGGSSSSAAVLKTASSRLGQIVVDAQGRTVYFFDKDTAKSGKSVCSGQCLQMWPAVTTTSGSPSAEGVTGTVGTITRDDGSKQVTLNGMPLYLFAGDAKAGDTTGQGFQNIWWVVSPSGTKITGATSSTSTGQMPSY